MVLDSKVSALTVRQDGQETAKTYLDVEGLQSLDDQQLLDAYEALQGETLEHLERRYRLIKKQEQILSDEAELKLIQLYLDRYQYEGLVPIGAAQWVKLAAKQRQVVQEQPDLEQGDGLDENKAGKNKLSLLGLVAAFGIALLALALLPRLLSANVNDDMAIATLEASPTNSPTPAPTATLTPTPLALNNSDAFLREGDTTNRDFYPVFLDVQLPDQEQPRVFVVQERLISTTEWLFEAHPDVASWISGTVIRPIIGIPHNESNALFIENIRSGTIFTLRTNTGSALRFSYSATHHLGRQDTALFRQFSPGFVLVLLGESDTFGMPTAIRPIILADYNSTQEMDNIGSLIHAPTQMNELQTVGAIDMTVRDAYLLPASEDALAQFVYAIVDIEVDSDEALDIGAYQWFLEDNSAVRYSADLRAQTLANHSPMPSSLLGSSHASIGFLVSRYTREARLLVSPPNGNFQAFALTFPPPPIVATADRLHVQVRSIQRDARHIYVDLRFFNALETSLIVLPSDVSMSFGFDAQALGPQHLSTNWQGMTLSSGQALDSSHIFTWNGRDPYATLYVAGRVYSISLIDN